MSFSVIVNADDFGITRGANESIIACHISGSVTSTTLMANMPAAEHAAILASCHPALGVGLHFNLTSGRPLSPHGVQQILRRDGTFPSRGELVHAYLTGRVREVEIAFELAAQFERMRELGLRPTHLDSHQHVHMLPGIFRVVSQFAASQRIPIRMPWRWPGRVRRKGFRRIIREQALAALTEYSRRGLPVGVPSNTGLCSIFDLDLPASDITPSAYAQLLDSYRSGIVELMVHPAVADNELKASTAIGEFSAVEDRLFRSTFLRKYVESRGGALVNYRDLA